MYHLVSASMVVTDCKSEHILSSRAWRSAHLRLVGALESLLPGQTAELVLRFPPVDEWLLEGGRARLGPRTAGQKVGGDGEVGTEGWAFRARAALKLSPPCSHFHLCLTFAVRRCCLQECGECALPMCSGIPSPLSPPLFFLWVAFRHDGRVPLDTQDDSAQVVSFCT